MSLSLLMDNTLIKKPIKNQIKNKKIKIMFTDLWGGEGDPNRFMRAFKTFGFNVDAFTKLLVTYNFLS